MFNIAIFNTYVLISKLLVLQKLSIVNFQLDIAENMSCNLSLLNYLTCGRSAQSKCPLRIEVKHWAHFLEHIPETIKKQHPPERCLVCMKHNIKSEMTWQCKTCLISLHIPKCSYT